MTARDGDSDSLMVVGLFILTLAACVILILEAPDAATSLEDSTLEVRKRIDWPFTRELLSVLTTRLVRVITFLPNDILVGGGFSLTIPEVRVTGCLTPLFVQLELKIYLKMLNLTARYKTT